MKSSMLICDSKDLLIKKNVLPLFWKREKFNESGYNKNIYDLIEEKPQYYKNKYLEFVHDLHSKQVNLNKEKIKILNLFKLDNKFNVWWLTNISEKLNYEKSKNINEIIKCFALEKYLQKLKIKKIFLNLKNEQTIEVIKQLCKRRGINCNNLLEQNSSFKEIHGRISIKIFFFTIIALFKEIITNWSFRGIGLKNWKSSKAKLLFTSYLVNFDSNSNSKEKLNNNYWNHLIKLLEKEKIKTNWLNLYLKNDPLDFGIQATKKLDEININSKNQTHVCLFTFLNSTIVIRTLIDWFGIINTLRKVSFSEKIFLIKDSKLNIWPLLKDDWESSFQGKDLVINILRFHLFESCLSLLQTQEKGFFLQENIPLEYSFLYSWKKNFHKKIFGVPHTAVAYWNMRYFFYKKTYKNFKSINLPLPDKVIVNGKDMKNKFVNSNYPTNKLIEAEAIRYLDIKLKNRSKLFKKNKKKLKLLVALDISKKIYEEQLKIVSELCENKSYKIIICPHPVTASNLKISNHLSKLLTKVPFKKLLKLADIVITSNITVAAVDAYLSGLPVITFLGDDMLNFSPLRGKKNIKFASSVDEIEKYINYLFKKKYIFKKDKNYFLLDKKLRRWKKIILN